MLGWLSTLLRRRRGLPPFRLPEEGELQRTASGLGVLVLAPGEGKGPGPGDPVTVRYAGWTQDGKLFDASHPGSARFPLDRVIRGWTEGLQHLRPGGEAILVIPPELGYGARGAPPRIGPNATLVFRVELLSVG